MSGIDFLERRALLAKVCCELVEAKYADGARESV
jgi:hypothetical protein